MTTAESHYQKLLDAGFTNAQIAECADIASAMLPRMTGACFDRAEDHAMAVAYVGAVAYLLHESAIQAMKQILDKWASTSWVEDAAAISTSPGDAARAG